MGYGSDREVDYWEMQNSWGPHWGEGGHIRMLRQNDQTRCGWDYNPQAGTACKGGPNKVWVCGMCGILYDSVVPHFEGNSSTAFALAARRPRNQTQTADLNQGIQERRESSV